MIVGIHQPQYLPWLPYYLKIAKVDMFCFLDNVQYQKNGLHNRNEIKNSNGRFWLTVPVSARLGERLKDVKIVNDGWNNKHVKSIIMNYSKSLNFKFFTKYIEPIISHNYETLVDLNIKIIETLCREYFNISTRFIKQSDLLISGKGSELILEICSKLGADKYISGPGGKKYLDEFKFLNRGIGIQFMKNKLPKRYHQQYERIGYIYDISALDFVLNVGSNWREYYHL